MLHSGTDTHGAVGYVVLSGRLGAWMCLVLGQLREDTFTPRDFFLSCPFHLGSMFCDQGLALPGWILLLHSPMVKLQICGQPVTLKTTNSAIKVGSERRQSWMR